MTANCSILELNRCFDFSLQCWMLTILLPFHAHTCTCMRMHTHTHKLSHIYSHKRWNTPAASFPSPLLFFLLSLFIYLPATPLPFFLSHMLWQRKAQEYYYYSRWLLLAWWQSWQNCLRHFVHLHTVSLGSNSAEVDCVVHPFKVIKTPTLQEWLCSKYSTGT